MHAGDLSACGGDACSLNTFGTVRIGMVQRRVVRLTTADLRRLVVLLYCYESPYQLPSEREVRLRDERAHARLARQLLAELKRGTKRRA
jgi:hypothetical protein